MTGVYTSLAKKRAEQSKTAVATTEATVNDGASSVAKTSGGGGV